MAGNVRQTLRRGAGSKVFKSSPHLNVGARYLCRTDGIKGAGRNRPYFICEVTVLKTEPFLKPAEIEKLPSVKRPNAEGSKAAIKIPQDTEWGGGLMINCLMGVTGDPQEAFGVGFAEDSDEVQKAGDYIEELADEERNPCKGLQFYIDVISVPKKGEEKKENPDLTFRTNYTHVGDPLGENKAWLDAWDAKVAAAKQQAAAAPQVPAP
jgi:hypothetical protein